MQSLKIGKRLRLVNEKVTEGVQKGLGVHGARVGRHPYWFLFGPILFSGLLMLGVLKMDWDKDVRELFTPTDAFSHYEYHAANEYFGDEGGLFDLMVMIRASDGGSLLRPGYPAGVLDLISYLSDNYSISDDQGRKYTFSKDLRINHENDNDLLTLLLTDLKSDASSRLFKLTYPVTQIQGENYYVGNILSGIKTDPIYNRVTELDSVVVNFRSACGDKNHYRLLRKWTAQFLRPSSIYDDPLLSFTPYNDHLLTSELLRVSEVVAPYVVMSFCLLIIFAVGASITGDFVSSKPWEAAAGVITVALASGSSFGLLFLMGYSYVGTLAVMPVLVLAMGLDVTFIVLRNWRGTDPRAEPELRLSDTWAESGTSVVITTLTNVMSTAIGAFTNTPAIHVFCLSTTIAVCFLFIYQITFFAAVLALGGRREAQSRNSVLCCFRMDRGNRKASAGPQPPDAVAVAIESIERGGKTGIRVLNDDWWHKSSKKLASALTHNYSRAAITVALLTYWVTALWGCLHLEVGLSPEKLFLPDSPVLSTVTLDKTNVLLNIFVMKAPNFTLENETQLFYQMVKDFESVPECLGPESTSLWLRPFVNYMAMLELDRNKDFYKTVPEFLNAATFSSWRNYMTVEENSDGNQSSTVFVPKFFFSVAYKRARDFRERVYLTDSFRKIADRYVPFFNATTYCQDNNNFVVDQLEAIPGNTAQDVIITGLCMAIICVLFIPNIFNTACAMITIFSINLGVFGYLVHWRVALDPVSMTSLLMSIGYSVDFTSHISYHYYSSPGSNQREKLVNALSSIGLPMIETGFSTVLSVGCLCLVPSYLVEVYFKTTLLVVILGLFHGVIVLPAYLAWLPLDAWDWIYNSDRVKPVEPPPKSPNPDIVQISIREYPNPKDDGQ